MTTGLDKFSIPHFGLVLEELFGILPPEIIGVPLPKTLDELAIRTNSSPKELEERLLRLEQETKGVEISCHELNELLNDSEKAPGIMLLDVREPWEFAICHLPGSILLHAGDPDAIKAQMLKSKLVVTVCHHGIRSFSAAMSFRSLGVHHTKSLAGGLDVWAKIIDPTLDKY